MHTAHEIELVVNDLATLHGGLTRITCSSVWDFGVTFEDGTKDRIATPRATHTSCESIAAWLGHLAQVHSSTISIR